MKVKLNNFIAKQEIVPMMMIIRTMHGSTTSKSYSLWLQ